MAPKLPFQVEQVQTTTVRNSASFHWHLFDKGIGHVRIRPRTPRLNGKVERSHRIDSDEFYRLLEGEVIDDANVFAERLQECEALQLPSTPRRPHRPNTLRTPPAKSTRPAVIGLFQLHS